MIQPYSLRTTAPLPMSMGRAGLPVRVRWQIFKGPSNRRPVSRTLRRGSFVCDDVWLRGVGSVVFINCNSLTEMACAGLWECVEDSCRILPARGRGDSIRSVCHAQLRGRMAKHCSTSRLRLRAVGTH